MKIITPPVRPAWITRITCPECCAVLEVETPDLRHEPLAPHPERGGGFAYVICPVVDCGHQIMVAPPERIMAKLRRDGA